MEQNLLHLQDRLTGTLVGLTRSIQGREDLITPDTYTLMLEGLCATAAGANCTGEELTALIARVETEQERFAPRCLGCTAECSENSYFDLQLLWDADLEKRALRTPLLLSLREMAPYAYNAAAAGRSDETVNRFFLRALYAVGMLDWEMEKVLPIVMEAGENYLRCKVM